MTDESPSYNADWRAVWRVAARRTADGWSAEFAIPFRSLRYPAGDGSQPWGFNVERLIRRKSEQTLWSGWSRAEGGLNRVSRAGHLVGLSGPCPAPASTSRSSPTASWGRAASGRTTGPSPARPPPRWGAT